MGVISTVLKSKVARLLNKIEVDDEKKIHPSIYHAEVVEACLLDMHIIQMADMISCLKAFSAFAGRN